MLYSVIKSRLAKTTFRLRKHSWDLAFRSFSNFFMSRPMSVHGPQISGKKYSGSSVHEGKSMLDPRDQAEVVPKVKVVDQSESTVPRAENEPFTYAEFRALLDHPPIATKRTENGGKLKCPQSEITTYSSHGHTSLERCGRLIPAQATAR